MPKLLLPISLKTELAEFHRIIQFLTIPDEGKLVTGGINGEIVIWSNDKSTALKPALFLTPCLSQSVGFVSCLQLVKKPIMADLENCQSNLLSIHQDNRVRLWDIEDGRCINISTHCTFQSSGISICQPLTPHANRFFVVGGVGKNVEIFDAWKMKSQQVFRIDERSSAIKDIQVLFDKKEIYVVDDCNILYIIDVKEFYAEEASVYRVYVQNQGEFSRQIKSAKCKLLNKFKITSTKSQLNQLIVDKSVPYIIFVYPKKIIFSQTQELYEEQQVLLLDESKQDSSLASSLSAPFPSANNNAINTQMQVRLMIQKSQDILAQGMGGGRSLPASSIQKLKQKVSFHLHLSPKIIEGSEQEKTYQYKRATVINIQNISCLLIFFQDGTCQLLCLSDITHLFQFNFNTIKRDYTFDFASFSYSKRENSLKGKLEMQLVEILQGLQLSKEYKQAKFSYDILGYETENCQIFQFNSTASELVIHSLNDHFPAISNHISQIKCLLYEDEEVQDISEAGHLIEYSGLKIYLQKLEIQGNVYSKLNLDVFLIKDNESTSRYCLIPGPKKLCDSSQIFHPLFYLKYGALIEEKYGKEIISVTTLDFLNQKSAFYFFGTTSGKVIGFPLLFADDKEMVDILYFNFDQSKAITFLEFKKGYLIASSESGRTAVVHLCNNDEKLIKPDINFKDKLNIIDIHPLAKYQETFSSPVKHILKTKILNSILKDPQYSDVIKEAEKYLKHTFTFVLANNSVIIYNLKANNVDYFINSNQGSIYALYFHPISDYFLTLTSEGKVHFWSVGSKRYERTGSFEQYSNLFDLEGLIQESYNKVLKGRNIFTVFKENNTSSISRVHQLLEYNQRYYDEVVNYTEEASDKNSSGNLLYEQLGELREQKHSNEQQLTLIWMIQSRQRQNGMSVLKLKLNRKKQHSFANQAFILFIDVKRHNQQIIELFESAHDPEDHQIFSYIPFIYPWGDQLKKADLAISNLIQHKKPVFKYIIGCAGLGQCFSFSLEKDSQYSTSSYLTSIQSLSVILHLINLGIFKDVNITHSVMLEVANLFTKNKKRVHPQFKNLSHSVLSRFCIDDSNEVMISASNLLINSFLQKDEDNPRYTRLAAELFSLNLKSLKELDSLFSVQEIKWLLMITYSNIFSNTQVGDVMNFKFERVERIYFCLSQMKEYIKRIVYGIELKNCIANPHLIAPCMKILTEGMNLWKDMISNYKELMASLICIYFHYNTSNEQLEGLKDLPKPSAKKTVNLDLFLKQSTSIRKRMKSMTIKTIISLVGVCQNDFMTLINKEILNVERHPLYPCSIIDIIRNYIKAQAINSQSKIPFFIEIILQSLDPNNPQQRKICHTSASKALLTMVQLYTSISYHHQSQKLAVGTSQSQIFIYDLRTAAKWRVLAGHVGQISSLNFDNSGKHLAGFSPEDFALRIWRVGSTGFFSSVLNMNGSPSKTYQIPRKDFESLVKSGCKTVLHWDSADKKIQINFGNENYRIDVAS